MSVFARAYDVNIRVVTLALMVSSEPVPAIFGGQHHVCSSWCELVLLLLLLLLFLFLFLLWLWLKMVVGCGYICFFRCVQSSRFQCIACRGVGGVELASGLVSSSRRRSRCCSQSDAISVGRVDLAASVRVTEGGSINRSICHGLCFVKVSRSVDVVRAIVMLMFFCSCVASAQGHGH